MIALNTFDILVQKGSFPLIRFQLSCEPLGNLFIVIPKIGLHKIDMMYMRDIINTLPSLNTEVNKSNNDKKNYFIISSASHE